jgi:4-aminobutyrate aminotransferase-like enzyme
MQSWRQEPEVVHTSTFAGAPLACAAAIATLDTLSRERLVSRSAELGARLTGAIATRLEGVRGVAAVRGAGFMVGIDLGARPGAATRAQRRLLEAGYVVSSGGGGREVVILTPALTIAEAQLDGFVERVRGALEGLDA